MARNRLKISVKKTILLVVEGKTEKIYFERLKGFERYSSLKIFPELPKHSNLSTLVDYAIKERKSGAYDYVWLVFDRDVLVTQKIPKTTLQLINSPEKLKRHGIAVADSFPCFEIWFLLHFCLPKQTYINQDKLIEELRSHIPAYCKKQDWLSKNDIYEILRTKMENALHNSVSLRQRKQKSNDSECSMCNVDSLIKAIQKLGENGNYAK